MQQLSANNYVINHFAPTLEDVEYREQNKMNELQKILLYKNRKTIKNAILKIGTMIVYPKA